MHFHIFPSLEAADVPLNPEQGIYLWYSRSLIALLV